MMEWMSRLMNVQARKMFSASALVPLKNYTKVCRCAEVWRQRPGTSTGDTRIVDVFCRRTSKRPPSCSLGSVRKMTTTNGVVSTCQRSTGLSGMLCGLCRDAGRWSVEDGWSKTVWKEKTITNERKKTCQSDARSLVVGVAVLDAHGVGQHYRAGDL